MLEENATEQPSTKKAPKPAKKGRSLKVALERPGGIWTDTENTAAHGTETEPKKG